MKTSIFKHLKTLTRGISDLLFPPTCYHCQEPLTSNHFLLCQSCFESLERIDSTHSCPGCATSDFDLSFHACQDCSKRPRLCEKVIAAYENIGPASALAHHFKQHPHLACALAALMALAYIDSDLPHPDILLPLPTTPLRLLERGHNPARLLAEALSTFLDVPVVDVLEKVGDYPQTHLNFEERRKLNVEQIVLKKGGGLRGKKILLVDDFLVTGATLQACAERVLDLQPVSLNAILFCR